MKDNIIKKPKLFIYTFTTSMLWFSLYAYVSELSTYAETLGASYKMIGLITASYGLTQLILRIPLGALSDYISKRKIFIILGLLVSLISALVTYLNPAPMSLFVTRLLAGVSAATWVIVTVLFSAYFKKEEAPRSVGIMNSYNAVGQLSSMAIGGFISWKFGTRELFLLAAAGAAAGLISSLFITEIKPVTTHKKIKLIDTDIIKNRELIAVSGLAIITQFITFATAFGFVPILGKQLGAENFQLSLLTALAIIPATFMSRLASTTIPSKIGRAMTINSGFMLSSIICVILPFVTSLPLLYFIQFISGAARSMIFPLLMGLSIEKAEESKRATAMGFFQAIYGIGMVFGPIVLGFIAQEFNLTTGFIVTGIIGLSGIILTSIYIKK